MLLSLKMEFNVDDDVLNFPKMAMAYNFEG